MAIQTNVYLNDEVGTLAKNNGNSIDALAVFSITKAVAFIVALAIIFSAVYLALMTYKYASGSSPDEYKNKFRTTVGAFFVLVLVFAVYKSIGGLTFDFSLKLLDSSPQVTSTPATILTTPLSPKENDDTGTQILSSDQAAMWQAIQADEASVRASLAAKGIGINSAPCPSTNSSNCTSVGGLGTKTVDLLGSLRAGCSCTVTVTGGTEWWLHSKTTKHKPGNASAVDVRKNPTLDKFIYNSPEFKRGAPWSICLSLFTWNGYTFCDESSKSAQSAHWHIQPL